MLPIAFQPLMRKAARGLHKTALEAAGPESAEPEGDLREPPGLRRFARNVHQDLAERFPFPAFSRR